MEKLAHDLAGVLERNVPGAVERLNLKPVMPHQLDDLARELADALAPEGIGIEIDSASVEVLSDDDDYDDEGFRPGAAFSTDPDYLFDACRAAAQRLLDRGLLKVG